MPLANKVTEWDDIFGQHIKHTTRPNNTDTQATLDARHAAVVALLKEKFPEAE